MLYCAAQTYIHEQSNDSIYDFAKSESKIVMFFSIGNMFQFNNKNDNNKHNNKHKTNRKNKLMFQLTIQLQFFHISIFPLSNYDQLQLYTLISIIDNF